MHKEKNKTMNKKEKAKKDTILKVTEDKELMKSSIIEAVNALRKASSSRGDGTV